MSGDARGWRIALLPDALVNPREAARVTLPDVLGILEAGGYGVLQLPPPGDHGPLLAVIADQVAEYAHHGYAVAAIGVRGYTGGGKRSIGEPGRGEPGRGGSRVGEPGDELHWRRLAPLLRHRGVAPPPRHLLRAGGDAAAEGEKLAAFLSGYDLPIEEQRRWRV